MPLAAGQRIGAYEIVSQLGAGGMGEVYRARDSKLKREVAIKVLPSDVAGDPERLARFQREAEVLASLNHPHIAQVFGIEDGALVMELVDGEDLAQRIARGPIALDEALPIARQIADALEAAHDHGIIHRDLKPANVKVRDDGTVKVLDFGLAKSLDSGRAPSSDIDNSPTIASPVTGMNVILGTAAYMSPEQARGRNVDRRTDVWAFGCVLFEMLTATRAFPGADVTDIIGAVMRGEPEWSRLPAGTPRHVRALIEACLQKDRAKRAASASVIKLLLDPPPAMMSESLPPVSRRPLVPLAIALAAGLLIGGGSMWLVNRDTPAAVTQQPVVRSSFEDNVAVRTGAGRDIAITKDGSKVAFVSTNGGLMVRTLSATESKALPGTDGARTPFFSPDGEWIGYFDGSGTIKRASVSGSGGSVITTVADPVRGATWLDDGTIVFATTDSATGLLRVSSNGGTAQVLTTPNHDRESDHFWPHAVDGRAAVIFTASAREGVSNGGSLWIFDVSSGTTRQLWNGAVDGQYLASGHLLFAADTGGLSSTLHAMPFDLDRAAAKGPQVTLAERLSSSYGGANYAVSNNGTVVYAEPTAAMGQRMFWIDRAGTEEPVAGMPARNYFYPRISPDQTRVALDVRDDTSDIWVWDFARRVLTRVTTSPAVDRFPVWTSDSKAIIYTSDREDGPNIFRQSVISSDEPERLTKGSTSKMPMSALPDGSGAIVRETAPNYNLMVLPFAGDRALRPLVVTRFLEQNGEVSPDGRWLAYESNESGTFEIYVRPYPNVSSGRWQISSGDGAQPLWSRDGRELFYRAADGIMAARVDARTDWHADSPKLVVRRRLPGNPIGGAGRSYDIGPDGRFLVLSANASAPPAALRLNVITNWLTELGSR